MMNMENKIKEAKEMIMNMDDDEFMEILDMIIACEHEYGHNTVNNEFDEKIRKLWTNYFL